MEKWQRRKGLWLRLFLTDHRESCFNESISVRESAEIQGRKLEKWFFVVFAAHHPAESRLTRLHDGKMRFEVNI